MIAAAALRAALRLIFSFRLLAWNDSERTGSGQHLPNPPLALFSFKHDAAAALQALETNVGACACYGPLVSSARVRLSKPDSGAGEQRRQRSHGRPLYGRNNTFIIPAAVFRSVCGGIARVLTEITAWTTMGAVPDHRAATSLTGPDTDQETH